MIKESQNILEERLKLYKKHKAEVVTTMQRILVWEQALSAGELWLFENSVSRIIGMPHATTTTSPTEHIAGRREVTRELVEAWIDEDRSKMRFKTLEMEQIDEALKALTREQETVIRSKYFEVMTWRNIEIVFNERHSVGRVYITNEMLRKINREALEVLWEILGPLFQRYLYFSKYV
ncbi:conserved hypothetical protein [Candidatus Desulfosporosinus infrequens]|uniref:Uncharacterized protein n=1 Tax=Candidatus Desulfosporosinus infrequens TaxID=2043169 RepID=A0A2U3LGY9_9FIRM|nr:conserved hypothetical protein [Candidatus Desulfosporosinus infrequens]